MDFTQYRKDDIEKKLKRANFRPLDVMVAGVTGAGKSTTLNAMFKKTVAKVGEGTEPETMRLGAYSLNNAFRVWDTPGLGDGIEKDHKYKKKMLDLLYKSFYLDGNTYAFIDMVLVIIEGTRRDMGSTYTLLNEVLVPNIQKERILVVINQADAAMKGRHWDFETRTPDPQLTDFLEEQSYSIQKRVKEATGVNILKPVYYSAEYGYHMKEVFDFIVDNMPCKRRTLVKR